MEIYLGTWQVAPSDGFWTDQDPKESEKVIAQAIKMGVCAFDTAQSYGKGRAEQVLAKVLRRFPQKQFKVDTKIMPSSKDPADLLKKSQNRLGKIKIDCLYLHWPRTGFDNPDFLKKMLTLKRSNLINKVGVCNLPLTDLTNLIKQGILIDRLQIPISLLWTRDLQQTMAFCRENKIELAAYSPTGMGLLSGKYRFPTDLNDARQNLFCFDHRCIKAFHNLLDIINTIAATHSVTLQESPTAVALAWVCSKHPDILILGARTKSQLIQNIDNHLQLSAPELSALDLAASELAHASAPVCENIFSYDW